MIDRRKISIAIPTFERPELTIDSFIDVYNDERISEIVIVDDCSTMYYYEKLKELCDKLEKVKLYRNASNQNCYANKMVAVSYCTNEFCILLDSDNKIDHTYIEKIFEIEDWDSETIYTPSYAKPHFDFRAFEGMTVSAIDVAQYLKTPIFEVCLNAANYFVNCMNYLKVWDSETDPVTSDSIYQCYNWLKNGFKIKIVKGLEYNHLVHDGSHYKNQVHLTPVGFHESILQKLRELK